MAEIDLVTAFNLHTPAVVALVGAGGKTSLLLALARALPGRVVCAATTRLGADQVARFPAVCRVAELDTLGAKLAQHGRCLLISRIAGEKALGVEPALPGRLLARPDVDWVLVEADGARGLAVKAPAEHEPAIPPDAALVVPVMGIDALDGPLTAVAHRPERVRALLALPADPAYRLTPADAARLLTHPQGGLKDAPAAAQIIPFINKVHTPAQLAAAQQIARRALAAPRVAQVVIGAAQAEAPVQAVVARVTAVVLAAGESRRMGEIKQLLPWGATTVLGQTLRNVKASGVHDVVVVTGHAAEQT
jgi:molybdenum cofactor cytidylyltransferase